MLLGKPWIKRDQARKEEEENVLEQQRQELTDFMTRRIAQLIEEQENKSKPLIIRGPDVLGENLSNAKYLCSRKIRIKMERESLRRSSLEKRLGN
jgi:hypothetical protein